ncbi:MAG: hypothetical protein JSU94_20970 [Phycisphaerales bacterium]|nr:MAG: hypothetical protein JSU94_20970 [Phycisphaerales bacterium]
MDDKNLKDVLNTLAKEPVPDDIAELARKASEDFEQQLRQERRPNFLELLMKNQITKLAAAAAVVVAALIGFGVFTDGSVTYAKVIEPILSARNVILDIVVGDDPDAVVMHDVVVGSRIRRTFSNVDNVMILDLDNKKMLVLYRPGKTAIEVDIAGTVEQGTRDFLNMVRNIVNETKDNPDVKRLAKRDIEGRDVVGFQLKGRSNLTIWADAETALPVRIEVILGGELMVLKNIEFPASIDESLVSMKPPAGYTMQGQSFDMTRFTEEDFIETLRVWAGMVNDGVFPDEISSEAQMKIMPILIEKLGQQPGLTPEQGTEIGVRMGRGIIFYQNVKQNGQWQYTGKGVKLGDAKSEVCRFRTPGSQIWRIVYGDLSVKDAATGTPE